ncbi:MAG: hypothetical protein M0R80_17630 [Proteobacteria bacterium]|jgi:predicted metalloendopeptidase|nr:hypothetical protein [Pseudomonadota bacterium]
MDIATNIIQLSEVVGAVLILSAYNGRVIKKLFKPISEDLKRMDINNCKCFLVRYLADIEKGVMKDAVQEQLAYEMYDHYTKTLGGNSYIKDKWKRVMCRDER